MILNSTKLLEWGVKAFRILGRIGILLALCLGMRTESKVSALWILSLVCFWNCLNEMLCISYFSYRFFGCYVLNIVNRLRLHQPHSLIKDLKFLPLIIAKISLRLLHHDLRALVSTQLDILWLIRLNFNGVLILLYQLSCVVVKRFKFFRILWLQILY